MLAVRKNLTEILLEVTNEEILKVALETVAKAKKKGSQTENGFFYFIIKFGLIFFTIY